ncbi:MAG: DegV family protein [Erysipelotrichaceae bacterium]
MSNILIVTDTTSSLDFEQAQKENITLVPLTISIGDNVYRDHLDLTTNDLLDELRHGAVPTTSQPNIGLVEEMMMEWKAKQYDAIIILTISSSLSGTYSGFNVIASQLEMDNVYVVDSRTIAGPLLDAAITARHMADNGRSVEEILARVQEKFAHTTSFVYPKTLEQLKKGGRISPIAASMSSLLKIKPLLVLENDGSAIEKFGMARTDAKVFEMACNEFERLGVNADEYCIYIAHAASAEDVEKATKALKDKFTGIEIVTVNLPAVLLSHGGIGCMGIQSVLK